MEKQIYPLKNNQEMHLYLLVDGEYVLSPVDEDYDKVDTFYFPSYLYPREITDLSYLIIDYIHGVGGVYKYTKVLNIITNFDTELKTKVVAYRFPWQYYDDVRDAKNCLPSEINSYRNRLLFTDSDVIEWVLSYALLGVI